MIFDPQVFDETFVKYLFNASSKKIEQIDIGESRISTREYKRHCHHEHFRDTLEGQHAIIKGY